MQKRYPLPGTFRIALSMPPLRSMARPGSGLGEAPHIVHKLSDMQTDALKAALRDLGDARKLLDPTARI